MEHYQHRYKDTITLENILLAWEGFLHGKKKRKDIADFQLRLMDNLFEVYDALVAKIYVHQSYYAFRISDPKPRDIHKATVRDRVVHRLLYNALYGYFDKKFIHDSYSCRINKGTHRAIYRFAEFGRKVSKNNTRPCFVLKGDIRKFFANIDHGILKSILTRYIENPDLLWLLGQVIDSFHSSGKSDIGLPLGNLTSQLLVNVYMNEFDQFVKRNLKVEYYIRYADDFAILSSDKDYLQIILPQLSQFLERGLGLSLHPDKVYSKSLFTGVDFLGWVHFPHHRVLRTTTKRRMQKRLAEEDIPKEVLASYSGLLQHGNTHKLRSVIEVLSFLAHS